MIKKHALFIITLGLSVFIGGLAFAQSCPDVVGDWEVTGEQVLGQWRPGEDPSFVYIYQSLDGVIVIVDQQGCLFYGNINLGSFEFPMVGNMNIY